MVSLNRLVDVADVDAIIKLAVAVEASLGPIDVLANNAPHRSARLTSAGNVRRGLDSNVRGVFLLSQLVAKGMVARRQGSIVNISSILAALAVPNRTAYIASKGAIEALTRAMALALAPYAVRVNAIAPGLIATDALFAGFPNAEVQADVERYIPGGRFGRPDELAAAIVFVASMDASYLNGAVIPVDGALGGREAGPPAKPLGNN